MKKYFSYLLLSTVFAFSLVACEKEKDSHQLAGTIWTAKYVDEVVVLEFAGNNSVTFFRADENLNIKGSAYSGTYTLKGDNITFDLIGYNFYKWIFKTGTISGNIMKVKYDIEWYSSGERDEMEETYRKK